MLKIYADTPDLDLFLVDAPPDVIMKHVELYPRTRTTLRLTYATNRGGILLPQLFSQATYNLLDSFKAVFQHPWHFRVLFDVDERAIPNRPLLYILCNLL